MEPIVIFARYTMKKEHIEKEEKYLSEKFGRRVIILDNKYERAITEM